MVKSKEKVTFESALEEIEQIVESMDADTLTLDQSLVSYKRGLELLQFCQKELETVRKEISILDEGVLKNFELNDDTK